MSWHSGREQYFFEIRKRIQLHINSEREGNEYTWKLELKVLLRLFHQIIIAHYENCQSKRRTQGGISLHLSLYDNLADSIVAAEKKEIPDLALQCEIIACSLGLKACVELWNACDRDCFENSTECLNQLNMDLIGPWVKSCQITPWGSRRRYFLAVKGPPDETGKWAPDDDRIDVFLATLEGDPYQNGMDEKILDEKKQVVDSYTASILQQFPDHSSINHQELWKGFDREKREDQLACAILLVQHYAVKGDQKAKRAVMRLTALAWLEELSDVEKIKQHAKTIVQMIDNPDIELEKERSASTMRFIWEGIKVAGIVCTALLEHSRG